MRKAEFLSKLEKEAKSAPNPRDAHIEVHRDSYVYLAYTYQHNPEASIKPFKMLLTEHRTAAGAHEKAAQLSRWLDEQEIIPVQVNKDALIRKLYVSLEYEIGVLGISTEFTPNQIKQMEAIAQRQTCGTVKVGRS